MPGNGTELALRGVRDKLTSVDTHVGLRNLHTRDGRPVLKKAQKLLEEEWERSLDMRKVLRKPEEREEFEERFVTVKEDKSAQCNEDVQFCEALIQDLKDLSEEGKARLRGVNAARRA